MRDRLTSIFSERRENTHEFIRQGLALVFIIAVAVLVRIAASIYLGNTFDEIRGGTFDQISYDALAMRVLNGHGFSFGRFWWPYTRANEPTSHWSYAYTLYLTLVYGIAGHRPIVARLIQALIVGVLTPWFTYRIGRRIFNKRSGLIAALISAVYLYFINYGASLMTEALYIVSILWVLDASMRLAESIHSDLSSWPGKGRHSVLLAVELGIAIGISILLRQVILVFVFVLFFWFVWLGWRFHRTRETRNSAIVAAVMMAIILLPWIYRIFTISGEISLPNTNAGFAFFWSNHPINGIQFQPVLPESAGVTYQDLIPLELRDLGEPAMDKALLKKGFMFVLNDPVRFLRLSLSRIPVYFLFWPTKDSSLVSNISRVFSFGITFPLMIYGLILTGANLVHAKKPLVNRGRERSGFVDYKRGYYQILLLLFVLVYSVVHLISWANVRYRLPVDAILIIYAGYALDNILCRWLGRIRIRSLSNVRQT